jgi:hypothetical protein
VTELVVVPVVHRTALTVLAFALWLVLVHAGEHVTRQT